MAKAQTTLFLLLSFLHFACSQKTTDFTESIDSSKMKYLGIKAPGEIPKIFASSVISIEGRNEFGSVFSNDGKEFFFAIDDNGKAEILHAELINEVWTGPKTILSHDVYGFNDPMLSPFGDRLFFISNMPLEGIGDKKDIDIWYVTRTDKGWSQPVNAGPQINSDKNEYYVSFTQDGTMYFSSNKEAGQDVQYNFDIYSSEQINGVFQKPEKLETNVNTGRYEADVFVAPDESYLIFCAIRRGGYGQGDLYISFKNEDGTWTKSKNMGEAINNKDHQLCPFVTKDGKYLFFTSQQNIYWVNASIIEKLR